MDPGVLFLTGWAFGMGSTGILWLLDRASRKVQKCGGGK